MMNVSSCLSCDVIAIPNKQLSLIKNIEVEFYFFIIGMEKCASLLKNVCSTIFLSKLLVNLIGASCCQTRCDTNTYYSRPI